MSPLDRALAELEQVADRWRDIPELAPIRSTIKLLRGDPIKTIDTPMASPATPEQRAELEARYGAFAASLGEQRHPDHRTRKDRP